MAARVLHLLVRPFEAFFRTEALGGTVLIVASLVALVWANSPFASSYEALWATPVAVGAEGFGLKKPLILWINDLLMAVFFLLVGLEIKREVLIGELSSARKIAAPAVAALGGVVVPAAIFALFAAGTPASSGWGVPMATDIAFALGCMRLLGARVPAGLVVALTALAIIDDLAGIIVIALFYTGHISTTPLLLAGLFTGLLVAMNLAGVRKPYLYVLAGIPLWIAVLKSGVHATLAGVVVGLCVPARARFSLAEVLEQARELLNIAERSPDDVDPAFNALEDRLEESESPLGHLEHALHPWVAYGVVPLFALANAGVSLAGVSPEVLLSPAALGAFLGLVVGKQVGVFGATFLAVKAGIAQLPTGASWRHLWGMSALAGIGFTMSLFIGGLAFEPGSPEHTAAKLGVLGASLVSAVLGLLILGGAKPQREA